MKTLFQRIFVLFFVFSLASFAVSCETKEEAEAKKIEEEINNDPEIAPNDTIEVLDESERVSQELNEDLNEEIEKGMNDGELEAELDQIIDEADKNAKDDELNMDDEDEDLTK